MSFEGYVDFASSTEIRGWVFDDAAPTDPVKIEILSNQRVVATIKANQFREDLLTCGKGNGYHGFSHTVRQGVSSTPLTARIVGKRWTLQSSSRPPISSRLMGILNHPLEYGLPTLDYAFTPIPTNPDDAAIVQRLIEAYHRALKDQPVSNPQSDLWSVLDRLFHKEITQLLQRRDHAAVTDYLRDAHARGLTHGVTQGASTTELLRARPDAQHTAAAQFMDFLASFAEFLGVLDVESAEQLGPWAENFHADPQVLFEKISALLDIPIIPPPVIGSLFGLKFTTGILAGRDILGLYAALRLRAIAAELSLPTPAICEIGPGLGSAAFYAFHLKLADYTLIDLPLMNVLQGYYLNRALPGTPIQLYGEPPSPNAAIRILPYWCFKDPHRQYDILLNQDSFPEMHPTYSTGYLQQARRNVRHRFLSINQEARAPQNPTANQTVVRELIAQTGGFRPILRNRHWLRPGYVEELFAIADI